MKTHSRAFATLLHLIPPRAPSRKPAIDPDIRPIHHPALVPTQPDHRVRDLRRQGKSSRRDLREVLVPLLIIGPRFLAELGERDGGGHRVGCDAQGPPFGGHAAGQAEQAGFRGAVGAVAREGEVGCLGGEGDDSAWWCGGGGGGWGGRLLLFGGAVQPRKGLGSEDRAEEVGVDVLVRLLRRGVDQWLDRDVTRGVDEDAGEGVRLRCQVSNGGEGFLDGGRGRDVAFVGRDVVFVR